MHNISEIGSACVGCFSCRCICPHNAIEIAPDSEGFIYPNVIQDKCIQCGLCLKVCPVSNAHDTTPNRIKAYYGKMSDRDIVKKSSSGGAFTAFAQRVIEEDGIVFGAVFDKETKRIIYSDSESCSLDELRKSKYVASETGDIFKKVKMEYRKVEKFCSVVCHVMLMD